MLTRLRVVNAVVLLTCLNMAVHRTHSHLDSTRVKFDHTYAHDVYFIS